MKSIQLIAVLCLCPLLLKGQSDAYALSALPLKGNKKSADQIVLPKSGGEATAYYVVLKQLRRPSQFPGFERRMGRRGVPVLLKDMGPEGAFAYHSKHVQRGQALRIVDSLTQLGYKPRLGYANPKGTGITLTERPTAFSPKPLTASNGKGRTLRKADRAFENFWYATASRRYEKALETADRANDPYLLQRAATSRYLNAEMDQAYRWYQQLYEIKGAEMSPEDLFRYAQTLKATGKYQEADRVMAQYNSASGDEFSFMDRTGASVEAKLEGEAAGDVTIRNLPFNSPYSEFAPAYDLDGKLVVAASRPSSGKSSRKYRWNDQAYLDLFRVTQDAENGDFTGLKEIPGAVNSKYHEAGVAYAPDGKTLYFTRNNYDGKLRHDAGKISHLKIYRSHLTEEGWGRPEEVPFNSDRFSTGHPAVSPDGSKLYFVSDMPGSIGLTDLFVVDILTDGTFSAPRNLGREINTTKREMFPFVIADRLYFASEGHGGYGGLDIFEAVMDSDGSFDSIRNLGTPVNSSWDDFSYIRNDQTASGFFASNRPGGKGSDDIYAFAESLPAPVENAIAGKVTELESELAVPGARLVLLDQNGNQIAEANTAEDGTFRFGNLASQTPYTLVHEKAGYEKGALEVHTAESGVVEAYPKTQKLDERIVEDNGVYKIKTDPIYFDFDRHEIRTDAAEVLDGIVEVLQENPGMVISIASHTDARGSRDYNKALSQRRADATREYLISKGIGEERIESARGYGEEQLLNACDGTVSCSKAEHQRNRRSEFVVIGR